jgi:8-amino-7-oxononanoate synthase
MDIDQELNSLAERGLRRSLHALPACGGKILAQGKALLNFSSNDYLDLATDARVKKRSQDAVAEWGCGATGSRLMSGHLSLHDLLEEKLALMTGQASALAWGSGFLANLGVLTALTKPPDRIFLDRLCHASLIDASRLSGAAWRRFRHNEPAHLEQLLRRHGGSPGRNFIVADSVYSMDGDLAPLRDLAALARRYGAFLIVDEAHAVGVRGRRGGGLCQEQEVRPDLLTGTMSKSLGGYGGFAAGAADIRELLVNKARSFIFSTALPPACAAAALAAMEIVQETGDLGERLLQRAARFHARLAKLGLRLPEFQSQIIPVHIGDNQRALSFARALQDEGLYVKAIRPPTVPAGTARLRLSVTLAHSPEDLADAAETMAAVAGRLGLL